MRNSDSFMEKCMEKRMERGIYKSIHVFIHIIVGAIVLAAIGYVVMLLWNWLIPGIIGWNVINYWQALGLLALARILFGGVGKHWMKGGMRGHHHHHHGNPIRDKWMKMTPEERKEFMKNRYRDFHHGFEHDCMRDFFAHEEPGKQEQGGEPKA